MFFNEGPALGLASGIDFRNLDRSDTATVNVQNSARTDAEFIFLSANVASHELGHLQGLRHGDSFGPIGSGIDPASIASTSYTPNYPGPQFGGETSIHLMESDGLFLPEREVDQFFSERSAIRLTFNERGRVVHESPAAKDSLQSAQPLELGSLVVPNTLEAGLRAGDGDFDVDALAVTGSLDELGEVDLYSFQGEAGDLFNFEVISDAVERIDQSIDPQISVLDASGEPVDYYGADAFNDDEFESRDAILIDLVLPEDGLYYVRVNAFDRFNDLAEIGQYELFFHRFNGSIPEPTAGAILISALIGCTTVRRRTSL